MNDAPATPDTVAAFRRRATEARSIVHEASDWTHVSALAIDLAGSGRVAVSAAVVERWPVLIHALGSRVLLPEDDHRITADAALGIVQGTLGIAETGSVLLVEERAGDRAASMLPPVVIQLLDRGEIYPTLDVLLERAFAQPPVFAALVTGPSRTADIERALTIGVHGPHDVHVVILG